MSTLWVIVIFFLLSLTGAVILFKFFKSSAIVKSKKYHAGGAIAGFVILYGILYSSYYSIEKDKYQQIMDNYTKLNKRLEIKGISGEITPYRENTKVVLAVRETDPDSRGKFKLKAPCIDPVEDDVKLYIITEDGYIPVAIYSEKEMTDINIPIGSVK